MRAKVTTALILTALLLGSFGCSSKSKGDPILRECVPGTTWTMPSTSTYQIDFDVLGKERINNETLCKLGYTYSADGYYATLDGTEIMTHDQAIRGGSRTPIHQK